MGKTPAVKVTPATRQARAVQRDRDFLRAVLRGNLETAGRLADAPIEAEDARVSHQWGQRRKLVEDLRAFERLGDTTPTPSSRGVPAREIEHSANILVGFEGGLQ